MGARSAYTCTLGHMHPVGELAGTPCGDELGADVPQSGKRPLARNPLCPILVDRGLNRLDLKQAEALLMGVSLAQRVVRRPTEPRYCQTFPPMARALPRDGSCCDRAH